MILGSFRFQDMEIEVERTIDERFGHESIWLTRIEPGPREGVGVVGPSGGLRTTNHFGLGLRRHELEAALGYFLKRRF